MSVNPATPVHSVTQVGTSLVLGAFSKEKTQNVAVAVFVPNKIIYLVFCAQLKSAALLATKWRVHQQLYKVHLHFRKLDWEFQGALWMHFVLQKVHSVLHVLCVSKCTPTLD